MREVAFKVAKDAISDVLPDVAVSRALKGMEFARKVYVVAIGKAGWRMARAASDALVVTGPTGTNVNDAVIAFIAE